MLTYRISLDLSFYNFFIYNIDLLYLKADQNGNKKI